MSRLSTAGRKRFRTDDMPPPELHLLELDRLEGVEVGRAEVLVEDDRLLDLAGVLRESSFGLGRLYELLSGVF
jgi:hypothetical protein